MAVPQGRGEFVWGEELSSKDLYELLLRNFSFPETKFHLPQTNCCTYLASDAEKEGNIWKFQLTKLRRKTVFWWLFLLLLLLLFPEQLASWKWRVRVLCARFPPPPFPSFIFKHLGQSNLTLVSVTNLVRQDFSHTLHKRLTSHKVLI